VERTRVLAVVAVSWAWMALELALGARAWWLGRERVTGRLPYRAKLAAAACLLATLLPAGLPLLARAGIPLRRALWAVAVAVAASAVLAARRVARERAVRIRIPDSLQPGGVLGIEAEVPDMPGAARVMIAVWCERRRWITTRRTMLQRVIVWHREQRHRMDALPLAGGRRWVRERIVIPGDVPPSGREGRANIVWRVRVAAQGRRTLVADRPFQVIHGAAPADLAEWETPLSPQESGGPDLPPGARVTVTGTGWRLEHRPQGYSSYLRRSAVTLIVAMIMVAVIIAASRMVSESFVADVLLAFGVIVGLTLLWSSAYVLTLPWRRVRIERDGDILRWRVGWLRRGSVRVAAIRGVWPGLWSYIGLLDRGEVGAEDPRLWLELDGRKRYLGVVGMPADAPMLADWLRRKLGLEHDTVDGGETAERS